jgi:hypothetical protein
MKTLVEHVSGWAFMAAWVAGWVLAKGFWSTLAAVFVPPWGWYLIAERLIA